MAKRALFCQILQRAAYHYRTLTSFELFSDSIGIILTHRWHWIYLYEKQTQQTTRLIFSWTRNMEIWTTISHNIWMLKLWLLSQILSSVYWIVLYILNVCIYIYIYIYIFLSMFNYISLLRVKGLTPWSLFSKYWKRSKFHFFHATLHT